MSIAIMQPYIFPYIGYFQLAFATDKFVFYDDVNYINRGWINRNQILVNGASHMFSLPCKEASQNKLIMEIEATDDPKAIQKLMATFSMAYSKAPFYKEVYALVQNTFSYPSGTSIAEIAASSVTNVCAYLGLRRQFTTSSLAYPNRHLKKADRLIDICHREQENEYINAAGGKELYTKEYFAERNVNISFLIAHKVDYPQFKNTFVPWLSIVDILMFNSPATIREQLLPSYHLD